jgi:ribulose-5-phosphate 4-epimerase/fuculose-1-phosphate aldolase
MALQEVFGGRDVRNSVSEEEWQTRVDLAVAYQLISDFSGDDLTYNHLSARVPGEPNHILIKPIDIMFSEVTASSLLKYDLEGNPQTEGASQLWGGGFVIHCGVMKERPDVNAAFHTHTPAIMGVCSQKQGLLPINQYALTFYKKIAYHDFHGFEFNEELREPLFRDLGDKNVMLMRNHGCLICTASVGHAFVLHHFLELACQGQLAAMTGGAEITLPDEDVLEFAVGQLGNLDPERALAKDWPACLRKAQLVAPGFDS